MELTDILRHIDPAACNYGEWVQVGMALKHEGYPVSAWDDWSARDGKRYHHGECQEKWQSFREEANNIVTGGTIVEMAKQRGWRPPAKDDTPLAWDAPLVCEGDDKKAIIDKNWLEGEDVHEPSNPSWEPEKELVLYLETLFQPSEYIGYVTESVKRDDRWSPASSGIYSRTAGEIIEALKAGKDIPTALSADYNQECGAWIRFNPLNGAGVKNANVTDYRYALIESDSLSIDKQNALIREMQLPVAALVFSGGKSLHAIVHVDAKDYAEYRKRVDFLYAACEKNGLALDKQNRNPSRLSRMPGIWRGGKKQFLIGVNLGHKNYVAWEEWYAEQTDELPDFENLASVWDSLPPLATPLIDGILRQGHKMLISGPSKAGKSFAQIEMTIAIAEGKKWMGWQCAQGPVVYVNFELDRASCLHRFKDVYKALKIPETNLKNIDIWNLRGKSMQLDKLAPKLIRRAQKVKPLAIILDPIYKTLTGDENSAEQMALFCNQFDRVCAEVDCSVIYCHHHSKGAQGGKKAMDRASGSGVFARDPDALLDLIELPLKESNFEQLKNKAACAAIVSYFDQKEGKAWRQELGDDDLFSKTQMLNFAKEHLERTEDLGVLEAEVVAAEKHAAHTTAWRIECTLREFEKPDDVNVYFAWPIHKTDEAGALADIRPEIEVGGRIVQPRDKSDGSAKRDKAKKERQEIIDAYELIAAGKEPDEDGVIRVTVQDFVEQSEELFGKEIKRASMYKKLRKYDDYDIKDSIVVPADEVPEEEET